MNTEAKCPSVMQSLVNNNSDYQAMILIKML